MTRLPDLKALARGALVANADLLYRHTGTFTLDGSIWANTRFSVKDPDNLGRNALDAATAAAQRFNVAYRDIRLLKVHPEDTLPAVGAILPWDGGTLVVREWSQASDFTGTSLGTCVLER
ncbi:hypothetical protein [Deinococcus sp. QL22]|uniref:hypothetical protein n=1 Tax=Deinococcus sp. QL22 TaxID=2939437 RepID=UPI002016B1CC|nr:hypothetical protein [Deinococcus sp. QL22]UQN05465.1 hypothetical protein M1R55_11325 [Deinococcus sp. QL22]